MTILLVEQNAHQALQLSQRAYVMETGAIVLEGADLADDERVRAAYLGV
jgi:branched-chain amino acid transport system ATP-binding protein